jgi:dynein intermediate chain
MSELVLSGSMDWTVNLWNPKEKNQPLLTFESS